MASLSRLLLFAAPIFFLFLALLPTSSSFTAFHSCASRPRLTSLRAEAPSSSGNHDDRSSRKGVVLGGLWAGLLASLAPGAAWAARNIEEAREIGEKRLEEIEKAKGPLIILQKGVRYREELPGTGAALELGDLAKIRYEVYKGNGDYMFSYGYGRDFKNPSDLGETYDFVYGAAGTIPKGAEMGMAGMKVGGRRKILVPPSLGWETSGGQPAPDTFSGQRRLINHGKENLQFEVELVRVKKRGNTNAGGKA